MTFAPRLVAAFAIAATLVLSLVAPVQAANRDDIRAFMDIVGFDVALEGLREGARNAPAIVGLSADDFGLAWTLAADEVFQPAALVEDALDILEDTLDQDTLDHATGFYASDLGSRLVAAENESHLTDDDIKREQGTVLAAELTQDGSLKPDLFLRMTDAIGGVEQSIASYREVQVRFVMMAQAAGAIERRFSETELRQILGANDAELKQSIAANTVRSSAYTYRDFDDDEMVAYLQALSQPQMQRVYALMNAIQYTIMADRYEVLAAKLAELSPSLDL
ncbi:MAG: DUF2059 domain-containing protein [Pseudomonadota bacterium]